MENRFLIVIFLVISLVIFSIILKNRKLKENKFISLIYIVVVGALIGLGGFLCNKDLVSFSFYHSYLLLTTWILVLGILHTIFLKNILSWADSEAYGTELFFSVIIALFGGVGLLVAFHFSNFHFAIGLFLSALLLFILPYVFYGSLNQFMTIPVKVLRKWQYPIDQHIEDPLDREMESPLIVGFEFRKKNNDKNITTFRAKAPKEMVFGKLFYYFINDYNDRNPDEKIEYLDKKGKALGWIFYLRPKWFGKIRYIDPEETNSFNFIKENSVIVCKRLREK